MENPSLQIQALADIREFTVKSNYITVVFVTETFSRSQDSLVRGQPHLLGTENNLKL
jgi:hypothetical protein